ncbi:MAG: hypothetical protein APF77_14930 [Clostridia bacterium BRH_c25]|nr:MAG: hypothetical protein APF77_14930 [Clostridia bacterium BRH_c25]
MRKVLLFLFVAIMLFNTTIFADETIYIDETAYEDEAANNSERNVLASFSVNPELGSDYVTIKLSEITVGSGLSFSYNPESGFLYADNNEYRIYIKVIDSNIEINETALVLNNSSDLGMALPYRFKVFANITRQAEEADLNYYDGKGNISVLAEATLEFAGDTVQFVLQELGTSSQIIDMENVNEFLDDNMILVNRNNTLDRNYLPPNLIYSKPSRGRSTISLRLDKEAMKQLNHMLDAAYADGVSGMVITSAFRTFEKQTSLFNNKTSILSRNMNRKTAMEEASKVVAIPGSSEHQTGLAVDISSERVGLTKNFANTAQGKWLEDNSWKSGFIVRYPVDKTEITGIIYEPWHVRYVGNGHSEIMKVKNMCLEEYVEYLKTNKTIYYSNGVDGDYLVQYIYKPDFDLSGMALNLPDTGTWTISNCTEDSYILTIKL